MPGSEKTCSKAHQCQIMCNKKQGYIVRVKRCELNDVKNSKIRKLQKNNSPLDLKILLNAYGMFHNNFCYQCLFLMALLAIKCLLCHLSSFRKVI